MRELARLFAGTKVSNWAGRTLGGGGSSDFSASGGTENPYSGYVSHKFTGNGSFTVASGTQEVEVLLVAGGGGAGRGWNAYPSGGGGGGAGGFLELGLTVSSTGGPNGDGIYPIVVGAGGGGGSYPGNGGNSTFNGAVALGGGKCHPIYQGHPGGSGGGGTGASHPSWQPASQNGPSPPNTNPNYINWYNRAGGGTRGPIYSNPGRHSGQGYAGGYGYSDYPSSGSGGGGGGAGAAGESTGYYPTPSYPTSLVPRIPQPGAPPNDVWGYGRAGGDGGIGAPNVYETGNSQMYAGGGGGGDKGPPQPGSPNIQYNRGMGGSGGGGNAGVYGDPSRPEAPFPAGAIPSNGAAGPALYGGENGATNTGGGGGGTCEWKYPENNAGAYGGAGGSGIVIIRYPV